MISVIIPLYNKEKAVRHTIQSVLNQTFSDFELVVVDDGGTDSSAAIVKEFVSLDDRVKYFYKKNGGVSSARNYGLLKAQGEWVIFLDADDEMLPNNLQHLFDLVSTFHVNIASADVIVQTISGQRMLDLSLGKRPKVYKNFIFAILKRQANFSTGAVLIKKEVLGLSPYDEKLSRYEDAGFEINLFNKYSIVMSPVKVLVHHEEFAELSNLRVNDVEKDFIFSMNFAGMSFWQRIYMGRFICEGCYTYKGQTQKLKELYGFNYYWKYIYLITRRLARYIKY